MSKEQADIVNGILKYLDNANGLTDMNGYVDINSPAIYKALHGIEKHGFIEIKKTEGSTKIWLVKITEPGRQFIKNGGYV